MAEEIEGITGSDNDNILRLLTRNSEFEDRKNGASQKPDEANIGLTRTVLTKLLKFIGINK